jgi:DDE family transposase
MSSIISGDPSFPTVDVPNTAEIVQDQPPHRAGTTRRPHRVRTHCARLTDRLNCQGHTLTAAALAREVARREREGAQLSPELRAAIAKLAPTSRGPLRSMIVPEIELAAARRLPTMSWLTEQLLHTSGRGRRTDKRFALAVLEHMATLSPRPEAQAAIRTLQRSPLAMWAFDHPPAPKRSSAYEQIQKICSRHETNLAVHANVELIRRLAELADASGRPLHPGIGTVGVVDATMMEAHIPQYRPGGPAERSAMLNGRWNKVGYVVYTDSRGNVTRRCHGYKLVAICDLDSTLPLVWTLTPASQGERAACRQLLAVLFELWPTCPMHTLVGDALYDQEERFAMELVFDWGLHPCFPRGGLVSVGLPHAATNGVPTCAHGLMHREKAEGFPDAAWRAKTHTPRGTTANQHKARIRWRCSIKDPACALATTYPHENPRLYTYLPHAGNSPAAIKREALLYRRNSVEAVFSTLKNRGVGAKGNQRLKLIGDDAFDWVTSLAALHLTAARVAHATGRYEHNHSAAEQLGYLTEPTEDNPFPYPTVAEQRRTAANDPAPPAITPRSLRHRA